MFRHVNGEWFSSRTGFRFFMALVGLVATSLAHARAAELPASTATVEVTLDRDAAAEPIDGRLYLFLSQRGGEPIRGPEWFRPEPFFRLEVQGFRTGHSRIFDDRAAGFPDVLSKTQPGKYRAQAILDHDFYNPKPADGIGNVYSEVVELEITVGGNGVKNIAPAQALRLTKSVDAKPFPESKWVKEVELKSKSLSRFHNRAVIERAAVALPATYYDQPDRRYPAVYIVPGFGGSHHDALRYANEPPSIQHGETAFIRVYLSGRCKWGHHVYADSATNGPRGEALVHEMIPQIDHEFRRIPQPTSRFVMGHSSGGWSSIWLQVTYPEMFGGVWSSSPDPVDFRNYQGIDLYAVPPQSMYRDEHDNRRPIARRGDSPVLWYDGFTKMDDVIGRGGQLRSFEAVFSPLDGDRLPKRLWDRDAGRVDPAVATAWKKYDISLILMRDWARLRPLLTGKLHITMGTLDTFYLEGATKLLAERLRELGSDAQVTMVEGASHGSLLTPAYYSRVRREMSETHLKHHDDSRIRLAPGNTGENPPSNVRKAF